MDRGGGKRHPEFTPCKKQCWEEIRGRLNRSTHKEVGSRAQTEGVAERADQGRWTLKGSQQCCFPFWVLLASAGS